MTARSRPRAALAVLAAWVCAAALLVALPVALPATVAPVASASAANAADWNPGNIIDDALFYDGSALSASDIQAFLQKQVPNCRSGYTCLKDYRQNTDDRPADKYCNGYAGAANESAATIIAKVGLSCGISQKAMLVLLEKEQRLVSSTWPEDFQYKAATGQGCPDTAPCDASTAGFFYQVYYAARQFEIYRLNPTWWGYQAGRWNNILYNPTTSCGTQRVYIDNAATAGLYIYTPYVPNAAALRNLYGTGDSCSAYGNRNFWRIYTDWFGSTQKPDGPGAITSRWNAEGGAAGWLGSPTTDVICGLKNDGCFRDFTNGKIHWSPATGAHATRGGIQGVWAQTGWENGPSGYPVGEETCGLVSGGCYQDFQNGKIYWSPGTGAQVVLPGILGGWASVGYERGTLGYPTGAENCSAIAGACVQTFQSGVVVWTARAGARVSTQAIVDKWAALGAEGGKLGSLTGNVGCGLPDGGCYQDFAGGKIHSSSATGAHATWGGILAAWGRAQYERGPLGYPTAEEVCGLPQGGCSQDFQRGRMYWTAPTDAQYLLSGMLLGYESVDGPRGKLGYPTRTESCGLPSSGCYQVFTGGLMYWQADLGANAVLGGIGQSWAALGSERGALGYPTTAEKCGLVRNGCVQSFQGGQFYWSPASGAHSVRTASLLSLYTKAGGPAGTYGYPLAEETCSGSNCRQQFEGGRLP